MVLKKEIAASSSPSETEAADIACYQQALVKTLHKCSVRFSSVAPSVVPLVSSNYPMMLALLIFLHFVYRDP